MKTIEERILDELKISLSHKDNNAADELREVLSMISAYKARIYPKQPGDVEISEYLKNSKYDSDSVRHRAEQFILSDGKRIMLRKHAEEILEDIKGLYSPEEYMQELTEITMNIHASSKN